MIVIFDFGSQTTHLISRRLNEMGIKAEIALPEKAIEVVNKLKPQGIIFSGGPSSVYDETSPKIDKRILNLKIPILGICYGQQLLTYLLAGKVVPGKIKEYGPAFVETSAGKSVLLFENIPNKFRVWMSHGDSVLKLPKGFNYIASTGDVKSAAIANFQKDIYGVQFHPEVQHTQYGQEILKNFANICGENPQRQEINISGIIDNIKETVGSQQVVMALSGGTDSFVAATLIIKAIGKKLIPVYIDSGLMRENALRNLNEIFPRLFGFKPKIVNARQIFLQKLKHISDPERKRKIIGHLYVQLFEDIAQKQKNVAFLGQGTTYADFIHSKSTRHAALIKSHHNVGGLPKKNET